MNTYNYMVAFHEDRDSPPCLKYTEEHEGVLRSAFLHYTEKGVRIRMIGFCLLLNHRITLFPNELGQWGKPDLQPMTETDKKRVLVCVQSFLGSFGFGYRVKLDASNRFET